jgi:uncharacterized glyoxalase superfamily protein PhnB
MKAKPIPEGFHAVTPHLVCANAGKAIEFYKKAFGAEEVMRMPGPDGASVMHAEVRIGDSIVMICDEFPGMCRSPASIGGTPVTLHLYVNDADAAFKRATSAGAEVVMPLENAFWGDRYGKLKDPFGHEWSIATHVEDVSPAECAQRAAAAFANCPGGKP